MKNLFKTLMINAVLLIGTGSLALAESAVTIRGAGYGGSGCPNDSASVTVSPDGQVLTILYYLISILLMLATLLLED